MLFGVALLSIGLVFAFEIGVFVFVCCPVVGVYLSKPPGAPFYPAMYGFCPPWSNWLLQSDVNCWPSWVIAIWLSSYSKFLSNIPIWLTTPSAVVARSSWSFSHSFVQVLRASAATSGLRSPTAFNFLIASSVQLFLLESVLEKTIPAPLFLVAL